uniref:AI-2E family transporter n=1 Tax=uncultured Clostridium sp. TaxID=59620 RepID=UPI0025F33A9B
LLLTFFISYILCQIEKVIDYFMNKMIRLNISKKFITYLVLIGIMTLVVVAGFLYIPKLIEELIGLKDELFVLLDNLQINNSFLNNYILKFADTEYFINCFKNNTDNILKTILTFKDETITVFYSLILSLLFLLSKDAMVKHCRKFNNSKISFMYNMYKNLFKKFINSFDKVMQVQLVVALINSVISIIGLYFLGFPEPMTLGVMILILSLVPVFGTVISLFPLCLIAFQIGGIKKIIEVIILIIIIHACESYIISPKLMSDKSHLPIFLIFFLLLMGEKLMGVWGLLFGIPLYMFFMDILEVK